MSFLDFDVDTIPLQDSFDPVPAGWYTVEITDSEIKETRAGTGRYVQLALTILDGEHGGRMVWDRLNLWNPNQQAVTIAQRNMAAICVAVGVKKPQDPSDLHGKPLQAKLSVRPASGEYSAANDVKGYRPVAEPSKPVGNMPAWA